MIFRLNFNINFRIFVNQVYGNAQAPGGLRGLQTRCASTGVEVGGFDSHTFPLEKADSCRLFTLFLLVIHSKNDVTTHLFQFKTSRSYYSSANFLKNNF